MAATIVWQGDVNSNWSNPGNWDLNRIPQNGDDLFFSGSINCNADVDLDVLGFSSITLIGYTGTIDLLDETLWVFGTLPSNLLSGRIASSGPAGSAFFIFDESVTFNGTDMSTGVFIFGNQLATSTVTIQSSTFAEQAYFTGGRMVVQASTFEGVDFTATSATPSTLDGNTFNGIVGITNSGSSSITSGSSIADTFNEDVYLISQSGDVNIGTGAVTTNFNGDIYFASGTANVSIGTGVGSVNRLAAGQNLRVFLSFGAGSITLQRFEQLGTTAQNLMLTGTASLILRDCIFNANVSFSAPNIADIANSDFRGTATLTKNGGTLDDVWAGNNIFRGITNIVHQNSSGNLTSSGIFSDSFRANLSFTKQSSSAGFIRPCYTGDCRIAGQLNFAGNSTDVFTVGNSGSGGKLSLEGNAAQQIFKTGSASAINIGRLQVNTNSPATTVTLNTPLNVTHELTLTQGRVNTTNVNYLNLNGSASITAVSNNSFVDGPVRMTGTIASSSFVFPVGDQSFYRPISITPTTTDPSYYFTAQYFAANHGNGVFGPGLATVSILEYWVLDRNAGPSTPAIVGLSWDENAVGGPGYITDPSELRVVGWSGTQWDDHGNGFSTPDATTGTVQSLGTVNAFNIFTLGSRTPVNPLPIGLASFHARINLRNNVMLEWTTSSERNNDYFEILHSKAGIEFETIGKVDGAGNSDKQRNYHFTDYSPSAGFNYYRLKQIDFDGKSDYSKLLVVKIEASEFSVYPTVATAEIFFDVLQDHVTISDAVGRLRIQAENVSSIDTSKLPGGVYLVRNASGKTARFTINR